MSTRQRLLDETVDIVRREGIGALTTVRITRQAGIAQPGFYKHFKNVDMCLQEATAQLAAGLRDMFAEMRRSLVDRNDPEQLAQHYLEIFDIALRERTFLELGLRYRYDASPVGEAIREVYRRMREDFLEDLWDLGVRAGLQESHRPQLRRLSDMILSTCDGCLQILLTEPGVDRVAMANELAHYTIAGTIEAFSGMLGRQVSRRSG